MEVAQETSVVKKCARCSKYKDVSKFGFRKSRNMPCSYCKPCRVEITSENTQRRKAADPEAERKRVWRNKLWCLYRITEADYERHLVRQGYKCAICWQPHTEEKTLYVDHVTLPDGSPFVRGLLCNQCNSGIGMLRDDPNVINRAKLYVEDAILETYGIP